MRKKKTFMLLKKATPQVSLIFIFPNSNIRLACIRKYREINIAMNGLKNIWADEMYMRKSEGCCFCIYLNIQGM